MAKLHFSLFMNLTHIASFRLKVSQAQDLQALHKHISYLFFT